MSQDSFKQEMKNFILNSPEKEVIDCLVSLIIFLDNKKSLKKEDKKRIEEIEKTYDFKLPENTFKKTLSELNKQKLQRQLNIASAER